LSLSTHFLKEVRPCLTIGLAFLKGTKQRPPLRNNKFPGGLILAVLEKSLALEFPPKETCMYFAIVRYAEYIFIVCLNVKRKVPQCGDLQSKSKFHIACQHLEFLLSQTD